MFPVSGVAKSVKRISGFHTGTFQSFIFHKPYNFFNISISALSLIAFFIVKGRNRLYIFLAIVAITLFYLQNALRSDWGIWGWYFYPIPVLSFLIANEPLKIATDFSGKDRMKSIASLLSAVISIGGLCGGFILLITYSFPIRFISKYRNGKIDILHIAAFKIRDFEASHKGIYAMGDKAAIVGYLISSPLIQLEGLVMDKKYLDRLATHKKLKPLLNEYKVSYYIASNPIRLKDSTYLISEPLQSNGSSNKITDTIDWKIEKQFTLYARSLVTTEINDVTKTVIFKVPE